MVSNCRSETRKRPLDRPLSAHVPTADREGRPPFPGPACNEREPCGTEPRYPAQPIPMSAGGRACSTIRPESRAPPASRRDDDHEHGAFGPATSVLGRGRLDAIGLERIWESARPWNGALARAGGMLSL
jgi:hypothetical protein